MDYDKNDYNGYQNPSQGYEPYGGGPGHTPVVIVGEQKHSQKSSNMAVTSLVLGILALVFVLLIFYFSFIMGLIGLILGIVSLARHQEGKGVAIAGVITSSMALILSLLIGFLYFVILFGPIGSGANDLYYEYDSQPYEVVYPMERSI